MVRGERGCDEEEEEGEAKSRQETEIGERRMQCQFFSCREAIIIFIFGLHKLPPHANGAREYNASVRNKHVEAKVIFGE